MYNFVQMNFENNPKVLITPNVSFEKANYIFVILRNYNNTKFMWIIHSNSDISSNEDDRVSLFYREHVWMISNKDLCP